MRTLTGPMAIIDGLKEPLHCCREFSVLAVCCNYSAKLTFFPGGFQAPLESVRPKRSNHCEHGACTLSNRAGSAELLCTVSLLQQV